MSCPYCGAPRNPTSTRDGLVVHANPLRVNFRGRRLELTRKQAEIMEPLIRFGRASFEILDRESSRPTIRATVNQLRKRLPPQIRISSVHDWGYEIEIAAAD